LAQNGRLASIAPLPSFFLDTTRFSVDIGAESILVQYKLLQQHQQKMKKDAPRISISSKERVDKAPRNTVHVKHSLLEYIQSRKRELSPRQELMHHLLQKDGLLRRAWRETGEHAAFLQAIELELEKELDFSVEQKEALLHFLEQSPDPIIQTGKLRRRMLYFQNQNQQSVVYPSLGYFRSREECALVEVVWNWTEFKEAFDFQAQQQLYLHHAARELERQFTLEEGAIQTLFYDISTGQYYSV